MSTILEIWRLEIERHFRYHPDREAAVARLMSGECSPEEVDLLYAEAERWTREAFKDLKGEDNGDGTIMFRVVSDVRDQ